VHYPLAAQTQHEHIQAPLANGMGGGGVKVSQTGWCLSGVVGEERLQVSGGELPPPVTSRWLAHDGQQTTTTSTAAAWWGGGEGRQRPLAVGEGVVGTGLYGLSAPSCFPASSPLWRCVLTPLL